MRILILHRELAFPADNGGKLRAAHVARYLSRHHQVACLAFGQGEQVRSVGDLPDVRDFQHFQCIPLPTPVPLWRRAFSGQPSEFYNLSSDEMRQAVADQMAKLKPEVILISDPGLTPYIERFKSQVLVLDYLMVQPLSLERLANLSRGWRRWMWRLRRQRSIAYHRRIASLFDLCLVNSQEDYDDLKQHSAAWRRIEFFPNGLDLDEYPLGLAEPKPGSMVYAGSVTYLPNRDAVQYMVDAILPRVRSQCPNAQLLVTGAVPTDGSAPQAEGVAYTGRVDDVRRVISGAWLSVVPLRSGAGGTRFKVLESLALGTPIISTKIGAEGVQLSNDVDVIVRDDPDQFADQIVQVLSNGKRREELSRNGRSLMERRYDWNRLGAQLTSICEELIASRKATA